MDVKDLYDQLGRLESRVSGNSAYPIHKQLVFENKKFKDLNDWLIEKINPTQKTTVLDAGCGVGKTLFMLEEKYGIDGLGISLSPVEIQLANNFKKKNKVRSIYFNVASFDDKFDRKYDVIVAVESIKHSGDYRKSIGNLAQYLKPGGVFWLVEDVRLSAEDELLKADQFKKWWHVPHLFTQSDIESVCKYSGLELKELIDLSTFMNQPSLLKAKKRWRLWNLLVRVVPGKKLRNNIKTFLGGFILDQWYLKKQMAYLVFKFEKQG